MEDEANDYWVIKNVMIDSQTKLQYYMFFSEDLTVVPS